MSEFFRIGEKLVSTEKINRLISEMLSLRSEGLSQQEVAERFGVDRSFISRLEGLGALRRGSRIAVIGFPVKNKDEILSLLKELGVDFSLIMTNEERWRFIQEKSGLELFNEIMRLIAQVRTYDTVIIMGSKERIKWTSALLDKDVIGIELGKSPLSEDKYVDPENLRDIIMTVR